MEQKCGGQNHTPTKLLEDSSMTCEETEDIFYQASKLDNQFKKLNDN